MYNSLIPVWYNTKVFERQLLLKALVKEIILWSSRPSTNGFNFQIHTGIKCLAVWTYGVLGIMFSHFEVKFFRAE